MTITDQRLDDTPPDPDRPAVERSAAELQAAARQAWLDDRTLTGTELGARYGRGERWGRDRIAEARAAGNPGNAVTAFPAAAEPLSASQALPSGTNGNRPAAGRNPSGRPSTAEGVEGVPPALVAVTVAAVAIVAVVTMVTSYSHTLDLAVMAGQARVAKILPAAVDGLVIAGSTSLLVDHHCRRPGSPLAWTAVVLGLASSMAANVVAVDPTLVDLRVVKWVMAAYAPLALAVSGHLLLRMLSQRH